MAGHDTRPPDRDGSGAPSDPGLDSNPELTLALADVVTGRYHKT